MHQNAGNCMYFFENGGGPPDPPPKYVPHTQNATDALEDLRSYAKLLFMRHEDVGSRAV